MTQYRRRLSRTLIGIIVFGSMAGLTCSATPPLIEESESTGETLPSGEEPAADVETVEKAPLAAAFAAATDAAQLAQSAASAADWSQVAAAWSEAIQALQAVPPDDPQWLFAQRKAREYFDNQAIALQRLEEAGALAVFPTLGNDVLDEQVAVYLSYVATFGTPDVLVIGSSRALQGLNPQILQQQLSQQGLDSLKVYTFAVNGATAQVVSFILRQLLTPEQMPRMIVWAGGSRSFNSGRVDRTFAKILESPGYEAVRRGDRPEVGWVDGEAATISGDESASLEKSDTVTVSSINGYGFLEINDVFNPSTYYQNFPRVPGIYDDAYQRFNLDGVQTVSLRAIAGFARGNDMPLVFVNLPLSRDYLDATRLSYERQFQQYLATEAAQGDFTVVDLLQEWPDRNHIFADPSHLNRFGAAEVATRVAADPNIPWSVLDDSPTADNANGESESEPAEPSETSPDEDADAAPSPETGD